MSAVRACHDPPDTSPSLETVRGFCFGRFMPPDGRTARFRRSGVTTLRATKNPALGRAESCCHTGPLREVKRFPNNGEVQCTAVSGKRSAGAVQNRIGSKSKTSFSERRADGWDISSVRQRNGSTCGTTCWLAGVDRICNDGSQPGNSLLAFC